MLSEKKQKHHESTFTSVIHKMTDPFAILSRQVHKWVLIKQLFCEVSKRVRPKLPI